MAGGKPAELRAVARALQKRDRAQLELRDAITKARAADVTLQEIADVLGVSRQRVFQIERGK